MRDLIRRFLTGETAVEETVTGLLEAVENPSDAVLKKEKSEQVQRDDAVCDAAFAIVVATKTDVLRRLQHHDESVVHPDEDETVNLGLLQTALAKVGKTKGLTPEEKGRARTHLESHAKRLLCANRSAVDHDKIEALSGEDLLREMWIEFELTREML